MPRRPDKGFDLLASLPWPVGILLGLLAFAAIRYGIPWQLGQASGRVGEAVANGQASNSLNYLAGGILGICWLAAGASYFERRRGNTEPPGASDNASTIPSGSPAVCRRCGSPVAMRRDRMSGRAFLACEGFPACREKMPLES